MTNLLRAAAIVALLAISSAHAEDNVFKHQDGATMPLSSASAESSQPESNLASALEAASEPVRLARVPSVDAQDAMTPVQRGSTLSPFAWVAEKAIIAMASVFSKPLAGHALAAAR